jgi:hypothetical protein
LSALSNLHKWDKCFIMYKACFHHWVNKFHHWIKMSHRISLNPIVRHINNKNKFIHRFGIQQLCWLGSNVVWLHLTFHVWNVFTRVCIYMLTYMYVYLCFFSFKALLLMQIFYQKLKISTCNCSVLFFGLTEN